MRHDLHLDGREFCAKAPTSRLPGRLKSIVSLVPDSAGTIADIGYDHGLLIRELLLARPRAHVIGVEIQMSTATRLRRRAMREGWQGWTRVTLRCGDGLEPILPGEASAVVLAGLGERSILQVLARGWRQLRGAETLVVMPAEIPIRIAPGLARLGLQIDDAAIAFERGRYYLAVRAKPSDGKASRTRGGRACDGTCIEGRSAGPSECGREPSGTAGAIEAPVNCFGPLVARQAPELYAYLVHVRARLRKSIEHLEKQSGQTQAFCSSLDDEIRRARRFRQKDICVEQDDDRRIS